MSKYVVKKEQVYQDYTVITYYSKPRVQAVKKYMPIIDASDGFLKRLNLETGEIELYTRKMVNASRYASINRSRIKLIQLLDCNAFDWFVTLTFDKDKVDRLNEDSVVCEYQNFVKRLQYVRPDVRYITVVERHKKDGALHFHMLLGNIGWRQMKLTNSGKVCCHWATRTNCIIDKKRFLKQCSEHILNITDGATVYNVGIYYSGYSTATIIQDKARTNFYVMKYIEKSLGTTSKFKNRFYYSRNLELPKEKYTLYFENYNQEEKGYRIKNVNDILSLVRKYNWYYLDSSMTVSQNEEIDIVQCKVNNEIKELLDRGLIPLEDDELDFIF